LATEEGVVTRVGATTAWIITKRSSGCETCASKGSCSSLGGGKEMEIEALNAVNARTGDWVVVSFETSSLLKISFLLYIFPIMCLLAGALLGQKAASLLDLNATAFSIVSAFLAFILAFVLVRSKSNQMAQKDAYRPKITRIRKPSQS